MDGGNLILRLDHPFLQVLEQFPLASSDPCAFAIRSLVVSSGVLVFHLPLNATL
jgi:hypothetical protein